MPTALGLIAHLLHTGVAIRLQATGASMLPALRPGDTLIVRPVDAACLTAGDVVLVNVGGTLRAHRIVRRWGTGGQLRFLTKGDNNATCDGPVAAADVLGRVHREARLRVRGRWLHRLRAACGRLKRRW